MDASPERAVNSRRQTPLLVCLLLAAVAAGGYLGWRHFGQNTSAAVAEAPPPVPVIAAMVRKTKFPDCADWDRQCRGAELGDGPQHGHGTDH